MNVPEHLESLHHSEFLRIGVLVHCVIAINEIDSVFRALNMLRYHCAILFVEPCALATNLMRLLAQEIMRRWSQFTAMSF
jgi:hypothetical protein